MTQGSNPLWASPKPPPPPNPPPPEPPVARANATQIAGDHYKSQAIEPWDYAAANRLDGFQAAIVKYVTRWQGKKGVEDLRKARHFLDKYIELAEHGYPDTDPQYFVDQLVAKLLQAELQPNDPEQERSA